MANTTRWIGSTTGVGLTWTAAINSADIATLASGSAAAGTPTIANGTALDMYADFSVRLAIASATPPAGAYLALYLAALLDDGSTFGDGQFAAGVAHAWAPLYPPIGTIPLPTAAGNLTALTGFIQGVLIPPGSFKLILYNFSNSALSGTQNVFYRTYDVNLNA